jgi:hypothetical protein
MVLTRGIIGRRESPSAPFGTREARIDVIGDVSLLTSATACPPWFNTKRMTGCGPRADRHHRRPQRPERRRRPHVGSSSTLPNQQFELSIGSKGSRQSFPQGMD